MKKKSFIKWYLSDEDRLKFWVARMTVIILIVIGAFFFNGIFLFFIYTLIIVTPICILIQMSTIKQNYRTLKKKYKTYLKEV